MRWKIGLFISARSAITSPRIRQHFHLVLGLFAPAFLLLPFTLFFPPSPTPPPSGSLCFISYLINSSEVQPFTLNPHLPVHMATGWPPSHTAHLTAAQKQPATTADPFTWNTRGNRANQRLNVFFLLCRSYKFLLEVIWNVDFSTTLLVIVTQFDTCNY